MLVVNSIKGQWHLLIQIQTKFRCRCTIVQQIFSCLFYQLEMCKNIYLQISLIGPIGNSFKKVISQNYFKIMHARLANQE